MFIIVSVKKLIWYIKPHRTSRGGLCFQSLTLSQYAVPFMKDPTYVMDVQETKFLYNKAPCMKAFATQHLLKNNIDLRNDNWHSNSPNHNVYKHMGVTACTAPTNSKITKDQVEGLCRRSPPFMAIFLCCFGGKNVDF